MKHFFLISAVSLFFVSVVSAQTVDSIKVEQAGELIKIHYKILNSTQYQTFKISVSAKINGGLESKLESLIGDVGENITGGKPGYIVIWDVLKDADEVSSVDFSVRAELISDNTPKAHGRLDRSNPAYWQRERVFIMLTGAVGQGYFLGGGRLGYMGNWGFSFSMLAGNKKHLTYSYDETNYTSTFTQVDISKRVVNKNSNQLHIVAGVALGDHEGKTNPQEEFYWGYDIGLIAGAKRTSYYAGFSSLRKPLTDGDSKVSISCFNFGIGIRF